MKDTNINLTEKQLRLIEAQQQFTGFYECFNGGMIKGLCMSMGLKSDELKELNKQGMLDFLPDDLYNEIVDYINSN